MAGESKPTRRRPKLTETDAAALRRIRGKLTRKQFIARVESLYNSEPKVRRGRPRYWNKGNLLSVWVAIEARRGQNRSQSISRVCDFLAADLQDRVAGMPISGRQLHDLYLQAVRTIACDQKAKDEAESMLAYILSRRAEHAANGIEMVIFPSPGEPTESEELSVVIRSSLRPIRG